MKYKSEDVFNIIEEIVIDVLDIEDISNFNLNKDSLINDIEGWDSLAHINIIVQLESHFGIKFSLDEVEDFKSINEIIQIIIKK